jgi:hypothetical protein
MEKGEDGTLTGQKGGCNQGEVNQTKPRVWEGIRDGRSNRQIPHGGEKERGKSGYMRGPDGRVESKLSVKMAVFWVLELCSLVEAYKRFRGTCCLLSSGESETLVNFYQTTWHYNPENSHLHTHCQENLKSYK